MHQGDEKNIGWKNPKGKSFFQRKTPGFFSVFFTEKSGFKNRFFLTRKKKHRLRTGLFIYLFFLGGAQHCLEHWLFPGHCLFMGHRTHTDEYEVLHKQSKQSHMDDTSEHSGRFWCNSFTTAKLKTAEQMINMAHATKQAHRRGNFTKLDFNCPTLAIRSWSTRPEFSFHRRIAPKTSMTFVFQDNAEDISLSFCGEKSKRRVFSSGFATEK